MPDASAAELGLGQWGPRERSPRELGVRKLARQGAGIRGTETSGTEEARHGNPAMGHRVWKATSGQPDVDSTGTWPTESKRRMRMTPAAEKALGPHLHRNLGGAPSRGSFRPGWHDHPFREAQANGWCGDGHFVSKRLASWSSEHGTGSPRVRRVRSLVAEGKPRRKAGADQKPHE